MKHVHFFIVIFLIMSAAYSQMIPGGPYLGQEAPGEIPEVFAPGIISLDGRYEQHTSFSPDGKEFYFALTNSSWYYITLMVTKEVEGHWTEPEALIIDGVSRHGEPFVSPDGSQLFFTGPGQSGGPFDLWMCERNETSWSAAINLGSSVNTSGYEYYATTDKEHTLYFCGQRPGGLGSYDIYFSKRENDRYTTVENVGAPVNSSALDGDPFIAPDGSYLIFTSMRNGGFGEIDLYISFFQNGVWSTPQNMGDKINTRYNEFGPYVSPDGKYLFFSRRTKDSDIYWMKSDIIEKLKENLSDVNETGQLQPSEFQLFQNYPNPFNPSTTIHYFLKKPNHVIIKIVNLNGREESVLVDAYQTTGDHFIQWQSADRPSGIYLCQLQVDHRVLVKKLLLQK